MKRIFGFLKVKNGIAYHEASCFQWDFLNSNRYSRRIFQMKQLFFYSFVVVIVCIGTICSFAQDEDLYIVNDGVLNEDLAYIVGGDWEQADGFISQQGTGQYLWAYPVIGPGDFHVTVELKLHEMFNDEGRGAAATFSINDMLQDDGTNGSNFGFVGGGGELFTEGNFFLDFVDMGETPVQEDTLLTLDFIREGDIYRFLLDGEVVLSVPIAEEEFDPVFRSGYYRVGVRPWRSKMFVKNFVIHSGVASFDPIDEKIEFIKDGEPLNVVEIGEPWYSLGDGWENYETGNFLFGNQPIFGSNFKVSANLQIELIAGSAASFSINGDNDFGFSGGSETMFLDGSFFDDAPTLDIAPPIEENVAFDFEMISQDNKIRFMIDGNEILVMDQPSDFIGFVGFRPWRSWMRIFDFSVEPLQDELDVPPEVSRSLSEGQPGVFYAGQTIEGITLSCGVVEGKVSNATIIEIPPEGWTISNIQSNNGTFEVANGQIEWQLADAQDIVELTYDLTVPEDFTGFSAGFDGSVDTSGIDGLITGFSSLYLAVGENEEIYIVENGVMTEYGEIIGEEWFSVDGALERTGTGNFLISTIAVADVNYEISADLTIYGLGGTAVSINLRRIPDDSQSNFGFEGGHGFFFVEGVFFDDPPSFEYTLVEEGVPFTFKMVRDGTNVDFMMDDALIHSETEELGEAFKVGLRPWRSRMQVSNFVIQTFDTTPVYNWPLF
jgi:hypothetical protein